MRRKRVCRLVKRLFFIIFYFRMHVRDSCVNERPRRGERGRNQISSISSFPLRSPRFSIPPSASHPRIFPSIIASPRLMRLKCVSKISSLIFFKKARPDSKFLIEGEGKIIPSNDRERKKKWSSYDEFQILFVFTKLLLLRKTHFSFFLLLSD